MRQCPTNLDLQDEDSCIWRKEKQTFGPSNFHRSPILKLNCSLPQASEAFVGENFDWRFPRDKPQTVAELDHMFKDAKGEKSEHLTTMKDHCCISLLAPIPLPSCCTCLFTPRPLSSKTLRVPIEPPIVRCPHIAPANQEQGKRTFKVHGSSTRYKIVPVHLHSKGNHSNIRQITI